MDSLAALLLQRLLGCRAAGLQGCMAAGGWAAGQPSNPAPPPVRTHQSVVAFARRENSPPRAQPPIRGRICMPGEQTTTCTATNRWHICTPGEQSATHRHQSAAGPSGLSPSLRPAADWCLCVADCSPGVQIRQRIGGYTRGELFSRRSIRQRTGGCARGGWFSRHSIHLRIDVCARG